MRSRKRSATLRAAAGVASLALAGFAHGQGADASAPVGLPAHGMLEDPFNRLLLIDELETHEQGGSRELAWDGTFWAGYTPKSSAPLLLTQRDRRTAPTNRFAVPYRYKGEAQGHYTKAVAPFPTELPPYPAVLPFQR
jgi:hypothetical protein